MSKIKKDSDPRKTKHSSSSSKSNTKNFSKSSRSERSESGSSKKSFGDSDRKRTSSSRSTSKDFSAAGKKSSRTFGKDSSFDKDKKPRATRSSSSEGDRRSRFSKESSFDKDPKRRTSSSRESSFDSDKKPFKKPVSKSATRDGDSYPSEFAPIERKSSGRTQGKDFKKSGDSFKSERPGKFGDKKSSFKSGETRDRKFSSDKRTSDGERPFKKSSEKPGDKRFKSKDSLGSGKRGDKNSTFKAFPKERPSEAGRKKAFKSEFADDSISYSTPPTYNLDPDANKGKGRKDFKKPKGKADKKAPVKEESTGDIRLNKYIANSGVCSRRDADLLIQAGEVQVNGKIVTELGYKVNRTDTVRYSGQVLKSEKHVYVLLNKPKDFLTTTDDPEERRTVMSLVKTACKERIYPVGRLDRQTTGLLLLTNDGDLAKKLTHPSHKTAKIYQADLDKPMTAEDFEALSSGPTLEDGPVQVDSAAIISPDKRSIGLEIHEGRNRLVRRMFEHLGYVVEKLDRVVYAGLTKKDLPRGKWRYLSEKEVIRLKHFLK